MGSFYVTTAIPYVNATPHLGFALELVQAESFAPIHVRLRQSGPPRNALRILGPEPAAGDLA